MLGKRTIIGLVVGSIIIGMGAYSLTTSIGLQTVNVDETFGIGDFTDYLLKAPAHAEQQMTVSGENFDLSIETPEGGLQVPLTPHRNEVSFQWIHLVDGQSKIKIQNTGQSEFTVKATFQVLIDPIFTTYHLLVIVAGVIIIGFSAGFSVRKPRGF